MFLDPPDHFGTIFDNFFLLWDFVLFQQIFPKKVMSLLPLLKTGGEEEGLSPPLPFWDWGFSPPLPKTGGEEGLRFRKSPEFSCIFSSRFARKS